LKAIKVLSRMLASDIFDPFALFPFALFPFALALLPAACAILIWVLSRSVVVRPVSVNDRMGVLLRLIDLEFSRVEALQESSPPKEQNPCVRLRYAGNFKPLERGIAAPGNLLIPDNVGRVISRHRRKVPRLVNGSFQHAAGLVPWAAR
jgi:hypothetical protein